MDIGPHFESSSVNGGIAPIARTVDVRQLPENHIINKSLNLCSRKYLLGSFRRSRWKWRRKRKRKEKVPEEVVKEDKEDEAKKKCHQKRNRIWRPLLPVRNKLHLTSGRRRNVRQKLKLLRRRWMVSRMFYFEGYLTKKHFYHFQSPETSLLSLGSAAPRWASFRRSPEPPNGYVSGWIIISPWEKRPFLGWTLPSWTRSS